MNSGKDLANYFIRLWSALWASPDLDEKAAAAFKALCFPNMLKLRSKLSDSDLKLNDDRKSLEK